jgi:phosphoesterase RecJ-like protein
MLMNSPLSLRTATVIAELAQLMKQSQRIWLWLHVAPDLDAVGANMGMAAWIRHVNPACVVRLIGADQPRDNLLQVASAYDPDLYTQLDPADAPYAAGDAVILVDVAEWGRCSHQRDFVLPADIPWAVVDHHRVQSTAQIAYIDPTFQSAAALVYQLSQQAGVVLPRAAWQGVVMGILGDSGFFRFRDTYLADTLGIVQALVQQHGIDAYYDLVDLLERNRPASDFVIQGLYLANLVVTPQYAYTYLTLAQMSAAALTFAQVRGMNGAMVIRNIDTTRFVFAVTERDHGVYSVSFRTCAGATLSIREFAEQLGGGGHPMAAAAEFRATDMQAAVAQVLTVVTAALV